LKPVRWLGYPLNRIVRRIKKMMRNQILLNIGVMAAPIGLVVALEAIRNGNSWWWFVLGIYGIVISLLGIALIYILLRDSKKEDEVRRKQQEWRDKMLMTIVLELKRLNMKGDEVKNDRSKDN
jgi:hypothetical protein